MATQNFLKLRWDPWSISSWKYLGRLPQHSQTSGLASPQPQLSESLSDSFKEAIAAVKAVTETAAATATAAAKPDVEVYEWWQRWESQEHKGYYFFYNPDTGERQWALEPHTQQPHKQEQLQQQQQLQQQLQQQQQQQQQLQQQQQQQQQLQQQLQLQQQQQQQLQKQLQLQQQQHLPPLPPPPGPDDLRPLPPPPGPDAFEGVRPPPPPARRQPTIDLSFCFLNTRANAPRVDTWGPPAVLGMSMSTYVHGRTPAVFKPASSVLRSPICSMCHVFVC